MVIFYNLKHTAMLATQLKYKTMPAIYEENVIQNDLKDMKYRKKIK